MRKRRLSFLGGLPLLLTALFFLYGCEEQQAPSVGFTQPQYRWGAVRGRTITVRGNKEDLKRSYMRKAFARYEELTGNTVLLEMKTHAELAEDLPASFVAGTAPAPDVLLSFGGTNIERLEPEKNFYDFTQAPWVEDLTDTAINQSIYNGRVLGLPFSEASVSGILYNKVLFAQLGLAVPSNQQEFLTLCQELLHRGVTPVYLPFAEISMLLYQFPVDSLVADAHTLEQLNSGQLDYADMPSMKSIVAWYKNMAQRGFFGADYMGNNWAGMAPAMRNGQYAMMLCWDTWLYTDFGGNPNAFGLMPAFVGVPENGTFEGPNLSLLLVNKKSPHLDAALDFITFLADPYNYNYAFQGLYTAPVFKNQTGSLATPQYVAAERHIEKYLHDSVAWLRIRGFSQLDAQFIQRHMRDPDYSAEQCLQDMDTARRQRAGLKH